MPHGGTERLTEVYILMIVERHVELPGVDNESTVQVFE